MNNLRKIRGRMASVQNTMKITNAMYLLASSKMKKARRGLDATVPFFDAVQSTMADILAHSGSAASRCSYFKERQRQGEARKTIVLVITSDKGLAGSYNHNVTRLVDAQLEAPGQTTMFFVGYHGRNYFLRRQKQLGEGKLVISDEYSFPAVEPVMWRAVELSKELTHRFRTGQADQVHLVYTRMVNPLASQAESMRLLPLDTARFPAGKARYEIAYLPSPEAVLTKSVPNYLTGVIYGAMVESYAAEQNARMQAMDSATTNAREMLHDLSLLYNRVRQAAITQEITEVIGGSQARER